MIKGSREFILKREKSEWQEKNTLLIYILLVVVIFNPTMDSSCSHPPLHTLSTAPGMCCLLQMGRTQNTRPRRAGTQMLASCLPVRLRFGEMAHCFPMGRGGSTTAGSSTAMFSHSIHPCHPALPLVASDVLPLGCLVFLLPVNLVSLFSFLFAARITVTKLWAHQHQEDSLWETQSCVLESSPAMGRGC